MNLNSGEDFRGKCPLLNSFWSALRSMIELARKPGVADASSRAVCRVRPSEE
jgi:hypothetical protein